MLKELAQSGANYNSANVIAITRTPEGKLVWLEKGGSSAGYEHILSHAKDFEAKGIQEGQIKDLVMKAVGEGK